MLDQERLRLRSSHYGHGICGHKETDGPAGPRSSAKSDDPRGACGIGMSSPPIFLAASRHSVGDCLCTADADCKRTPPNPFTALALMGVVLFGFQVWINDVQTLPSDFFPRSAVASVFGLGGTAAALASVLYNWGTGRVVDAGGYTPVFVVAGVLGPLGLAATLSLAGRITPLDEMRLR